MKPYYQDDAVTIIHDDYREALLEVISNKAAGIAPTIASPAPARAGVDLMDALRASVEAAKAAKEAA